MDLVSSFLLCKYCLLFNGFPLLLDKNSNCFAWPTWPSILDLYLNFPTSTHTISTLPSYILTSQDFYSDKNAFLTHIFMADIFSSFRLGKFKYYWPRNISLNNPTYGITTSYLLANYFAYFLPICDTMCSGIWYIILCHYYTSYCNYIICSFAACSPTYITFWPVNLSHLTVWNIVWSQKACLDLTMEEID